MHWQTFLADSGSRTRQTVTGGQLFIPWLPQAPAVPVAPATQDGRKAAVSSLRRSRRTVLPVGPRLAVILLTGLLAATAVGCSGGNQTAPAAGTAPAGGGPAASPGAAPVSDAATAQSAAGAAKPRGRDEVYVDEQGQKWFGKVPYDVFFDEPLTVAADQTPTAAASAGMAATGAPAATAVQPAPAVVAAAPAAAAPSATDSPTAPVAPTAPAATSAAAGAPAGGGWGDLISAAVLDEEVKNIRNFLNENLQSVGNYNASMLMIPPRAAALAVLAGVAMEHPESVSWKDDAAYVRDLAKQMNADTLQRGAKDQKRLQALFEALADTLNRSRPADLAEPPAGDSFADVAEMRLVMMRMEEAEKKMRTEAGSAGAFASGKSMVQHEAAVLATMSHTVTLPGYGYEDDPEFVGYGQAIVEAARAILVASEADDFASYELALSKISTTCQSCHSKYKND